MKILIISTNQAASPIPVLPAGACIVAAAAERAGHSVSMLDLMFQTDQFRALQEELRTTNPDVIGLSVRNIDNNDMQATKFYVEELLPLVSCIRKHSEAHLVLGGAALTVMPEEIMRLLDISCAVLGDGEATFPRLLEKIGRREPYQDVPGVASLDDGTFRANPMSGFVSSECMVPDYHRWLNLGAYRRQLATIPLQTKLGCRFRCVYCTYRKIEGETYRLCDPESAAEAALRISRTGMRDIEFVDNVFNAPRDHAVALCESFIRSGIRARFQSVELNPSAFDDELLDVMERAGFTGIGLTVENAADPVLSALRKGFCSRDVFRAAETVRRHKLPCLWIFMLGGPGETEDTVKETLRFAADRIQPQDAAFFNIGIRIYPGTELESIARKEGVLTRRPGDMLEPVFYVSPLLDQLWIRKQVQRALDDHMNFMSVDSFNFPHLPLIQKLAHRMGIRAPLWRHTRFIRRSLRLVGIDA